MFLNFLKKQQKVFEGFYWSKDFKLKEFLVNARDRVEALTILATQEDFKMVCSMTESKGIAEAMVCQWRKD